MAQPLTAPYRVELRITVDGLTHKLRAYCQASASILAPSGWYLWDRSDIASIDLTDAAQNLWNGLKPAFQNTVLAPQCTLYQRLGTVWNPVGTGVPTGAATGVFGAVGRCGQLTISMITTAFHRVRLNLLEPGVVSAAYKSVGVSGLTGILPLLATEIDGSHGDPNDYFNWARNKSTEALSDFAPVVSTTWDLNDKVRRARNDQ